MTESRLDEEIPKRRGTEGGRFTGNTEESGSLKPGNSVEEKTLRIGKGESQAGAFSAAGSIPSPTVSITSSGQGKPWTRGGSDHTEEPIQYDEGKDQKTSRGD